jgi:hypothetical protein
VTEADVRAKIDAMNAIGIDTIVITYVESIGNKWGAFYPSSVKELNQFPNPLGFDLVETIMSQADKNHQFVMLGIGRGGDPFLTYNGCNDPTRLKAAHSLAEKSCGNCIESTLSLMPVSPAGIFLSSVETFGLPPSTTTKWQTSAMRWLRVSR